MGKPVAVIATWKRVFVDLVWPNPTKVGKCIFHCPRKMKKKKKKQAWEECPLSLSFRTDAFMSRKSTPPPTTTTSTSHNSVFGKEKVFVDLNGGGGERFLISRSRIVLITMTGEVKHSPPPPSSKIEFNSFDYLLWLNSPPPPTRYVYGRKLVHLCGRSCFFFPLHSWHRLEFF